MFNDIEGAIVMFIPIVSIVAICALLAVAIWSSQRRREREIHYRHELLKRLADKGADKDELAGLMRATEVNRWANRREGLKLGGIITLLVGVGMMIGLQWIEDEPIWLMGSVPALVGFGLLFYAFVLAPREPSA